MSKNTKLVGLNHFQLIYYLVLFISNNVRLILQHSPQVQLEALLWLTFNSICFFVLFWFFFALVLIFLILEALTPSFFNNCLDFCLFLSSFFILTNLKKKNLQLCFLRALIPYYHYSTGPIGRVCASLY